MCLRVTHGSHDVGQLLQQIAGTIERISITRLDELAAYVHHRPLTQSKQGLPRCPRRKTQAIRRMQG